MSSISCGIVGLPNVGKSTLFNAITGNNILAANYPFATIEPNTGIVPVPDDRLKKLAEMYNTANIVPASVTFLDIAGLVAGASKGEGLGNQFLSHIRTVNAIAKLKPVLDIYNQVAELLDRGDPVWNHPEIDRELIKDLQLLTAKPIVYLFNLDESDLANSDKKSSLANIVSPAQAIFVSAKLESELNGLEEYDAKELLESYGQNESGLVQLINSSYSILGLQSFLTAGEPEVRAWTIPKESTAPQAAGVIHKDFERGFIAAEIVSYPDLIEAGSLSSAKAAGKVKTEGKTYIMQPDDVVLFKFNV